MSRKSQRFLYPFALAGLLFSLCGTAAAQEEQPVVVITFDQLAVMETAREVFGGEYDLGRGIAQLVRDRLADEGVTVVQNEPDAAGTVRGTILIFARAEASGDVGGVRVRGIRVGVSRRKEKAMVSLEARLIDIPSGEIVVSASASAESERGGMNLFARLNDNDNLATLDLSGDEFRETSIGEATHEAVEELCERIKDAVGRLGTFAVAEPAAAPEPAMAAAPMAGGPVGTFAWAPFMFRGSEHFRYSVRQVEDGSTTSGFYQMDLQPAGEGRVRMSVTGQLGDQTYSSTITTGVGQQGVRMGYGQFMTLGPVGLVLFNPMSWMMLAGRELAVGDGWSYAGGGESVSIRIESECSGAGQAGLLVVFRDNDVVRQESCLARDVALPLRVLLRPDDDDVIEMTLVEYRP